MNNVNNDLISRQQAIDAVKKNTFRLTFAEEQNCEGHVTWSANAVYSDVMKGALLDLPSVQPDIIRCKDCIYQTESWSGIKYCEAHGDHIGKDYDYCSNARRKENGH